MSQEIITTVNEILKAANVEMQVQLLGETVRDNNWKCDEWRVTFKTAKGKSETFSYHTGTGLREFDAKKLKAHKTRYAGERFNNVNPRSILGVEIAKSLEACKIAVKPNAASVLYCLVNNDTDQNFSDWCDCFGYDNDSIKAFNIYNACTEEMKKIRCIFNNTQIESIREALEEF